MKYVQLSLTALSLVGTLACGGDDDVNEDVDDPRSAKVVDLDEAEGKEVCERIRGKADLAAPRLQKVGCIADAVKNGKDAASCESGVVACLDPSANSGYTCSAGENPAGVPESCSALTVGELEDCIDAEMRAIEKAEAELTCTSHVSAFPTGIPGGDSPACQRVLEVCPNLGMPMS